MTRYCLECWIVDGQRIEFTSVWQIIRHAFTVHLRRRRYRITGGGGVEMDPERLFESPKVDAIVKRIAEWRNA